ncbi:hypothetical protein [Pasteuria penetrans]|uniref:hypothetical protein n=1 Tax=Pasteuria penetrans TaxID=86005 RepID=UPI001CAA6DEE|nr:hypothetical protein [Pasteuria penetrans]
MVPMERSAETGYWKRTIQTGSGSLAIPLPKVGKGGSVLVKRDQRYTHCGWGDIPLPR